MASSLAFVCFVAALWLGWQLAMVRATGRQLLLQLSAEQGAHKVARDALTDAGTELARLRLDLEEAKKRSPSIECGEMLRELAAGGALLHVTRIDSNDVFMMSPRTMR